MPLKLLAILVGVLLRREGFVEWHAAANTIQQTAIRNTNLFGPRCHRLSFVAVSNDMIPAGIVSLFNTSGPATVIWGIRSIIIYALDRVLRRWARPHVGIEVFKRIAPTVANRDAATTIKRIGVGARIKATRLHRHPGTMLGCMRFSVGAVQQAYAVTSPASATLGFASLEHLEGGNDCVAAITNTTPIRSTAFSGVRIGYYHKSLKSLAATVLHQLIWKWGGINYWLHDHIVPLITPGYKNGGIAYAAQK